MNYFPIFKSSTNQRILTLIEKNQPLGSRQHKEAFGKLTIVPKSNCVERDHPTTNRSVQGNHHGSMRWLISATGNDQGQEP
jgi:hypothetical protein